MSGKHQRALYDNPHLTATETSVLVRMASHIRQRDGSAIFASIDDTQAATKYSRRAVFQVVSDARRWGILIPTGELRNRKVVYRMSIEAITSFKGALSAPYKGAGGAPSTVQDVHPTNHGRVQGVHSKGAPGAAKGAGGAPLLKEEFLLTPDGLKQEWGLEFEGHKEFHQIDGVDSDTCDDRCQRLADWVDKNPALAPLVADGAGAVADTIRFDPEGGKRSRPPKPWCYEGSKGNTRYSDIVNVVQRWTRRRKESGGSSNGRRPARHMANTVEDVAAAEREVRGGGTT